MTTHQPELPALTTDRLVVLWHSQAKTCREDAARLGEGHSAHNELLRDAAQYEQSAYQLTAALSRPQDGVVPAWIVNDLGELGVMVDGTPYFLYKGDNIVYDDPSHEDGSLMLYRMVGKREFGETCWPLKWIEAGQREDRYTEKLHYAPGLSDGKPEDGDWRPLPKSSATPTAGQGGDDCTGCRGHGEVGGLTPAGYDSEQCPFCKGSGKEPTPAPAAPVSERARSLLADAWLANTRDAKEADHIRSGPLNHTQRIAVAALEQALTQQRGDAVAVVVEDVIGVPIVWINPPSHGRPPVGTKLYTTPQPSAEGLRDGYYLASFKRSHDRGYVTWWMADNAGYTPDLNQAGIYTELTPGYHDSEYTVPVPVKFIDRLRVRRMVDVGDSHNRSLWTAKDLRAALDNELESLLAVVEGRHE